MKYGIAVAGTHGKTTTTSLRRRGAARGRPRSDRRGRRQAARARHQRAARPGRRPGGRGRRERRQRSSCSRRSIAVVTNIDPEHLDYFGDMEKVRGGLPAVRAARAVLRARRPLHRQRQRARAAAAREQALRHLRHRARRRLAGARARASTASRPSSRSGAATARLGTRAPPHAGPPPRAERARRDRRRRRPRHPVAHRGARARGVRRHPPPLRGAGEEQDILVVDDYGHHPEEIRATLRAAREGFTRRLVVAFQPHRYSRTRDLFDEFLSAFDDADVLLLTEIYAAGEDRSTGVTGEALYQALKRRGHLDVRLRRRRATSSPTTLLEIVRPGDLVLTLGAGDIYTCRRRAARPAAGRRARAGRSTEPHGGSTPRTQRSAAPVSATRARATSRSRATRRSASAARPTCSRRPTRRRELGGDRCARRPAAGVPRDAARRRLEHARRRRRHPRRRREARARLPARRVATDAACVDAGAAVQLGRLARDAVERGLAGLEYAEGIPGTVGGALFMNAGAYGGEVSTRGRRGRGRRRRRGAVQRLPRASAALPLSARDAAARASS